uniref:Cytochrome P450 n=1 Tax=Mycena chlorophos TaxID=658473 RepID=A0ABQ0LD01_MYCCL|nr:cytochrome P450 [Mycena chlorophos]
MILIYAATIIVQLLAGHQISSDTDPFLLMGDSVMETFTQTGAPGMTPVDFFPILQHLPSWFPGTYYATVARRLKSVAQQFYDYPLQVRKGSASGSFILHHLQQIENGTCPLNIDQLKGASATVFAAGKTSSTLMVFLLAMVLNQDVQKKAQHELDEFIGKEALPNFSDRDKLPYLNALVQEVCRWNPVSPLGM